MTEILIIGTLRGFLYLLLAIGFVLVQNVGGIVNLAHGVYYMLGAYFTFIIYSNVFSHGGQLVLILSMAIGIFLVFILGSLVYAVLINRRPESHPFHLIITLAFSLFVSEIIAILYGVRGSSVPTILKGSLYILDVKVTKHQLLLFPVGVVTLCSLWAFMKNTRLGKSIEAVSQNWQGATLVGINNRNVLTLTCGISSALAALAGALIAPITSVAPDMWFFPLIKAFAISILGGMGNLTGGIIASFILSYTEILTAFSIGEKYTELSSLIVIIFVLLYRPAGILGFRMKR